MTQPVNAINAGECPTHTRYGVVAILVALAMVTYLDRACIGTLAPWISADLGLSKDQMSLVFSAFALAYAAFEIPTASWADRRGTRLVLTRIVLWWSSFTMATAAAVGHWSLLVTRFLFGIGEAGAWPTAARSFSRWIPSRERGTVQGIFFAGAHLAGGLTPPLVLLLMDYPPLADPSSSCSVRSASCGPPAGTLGFATSRSNTRRSTRPNWRRSSPDVSPRPVTVWVGPIGGGCSETATSRPSA